MSRILSDREATDHFVSMNTCKLTSAEELSIDLMRSTCSHHTLLAKMDAVPGATVWNCWNYWRNCAHRILHGIGTQGSRSISVTIQMKQEFQQPP